MSGFITPPRHVDFRAKKLFGDMGHIVDGAVAYMDVNGGGPTEPHTHEHDHLFIVTEGEAASGWASGKSSLERMSHSWSRDESRIPSGTIAMV